MTSNIHGMLKNIHKAYGALPNIIIPPGLHQSPPAAQRVVFREDPQDFIVDEIPAYLPQGEGQHLYLWIEKRNISTMALIRIWSNILRCAPHDIGYAGRKDAQGITRQYISVPMHLWDEHIREQLTLENRVSILHVKLHGNKLRLGHHRGNRFHVRLKGSFDESALQHRFNELKKCTNDFGAQRFSGAGEGIENALQFVEKNMSARTREEKFWASVVQSMLFRIWLHYRIQDGLWQTVMRGDQMMKLPNKAPFKCEDTVLENARLLQEDIEITGPLYGHEIHMAQEEAGDWENNMMLRHGIEIEQVRLWRGLYPGDRRMVAFKVLDTQWSVNTDKTILEASFTLGTGMYATVFLAQWLGCTIQDFGISEP